MTVDREDFAQECVRQGVGFGIEPHYFLGVAQHRSALSDDSQNGKVGVYRLTQAEWDANSNNDEFDVHFTPAQITSTTRQCVVFGLMARRAFDAFVVANNRNPSALELYLQQWPNEAAATLAADLQNAFDATAPLIEPAATALLDDPESVSAVGNVNASTNGPGLALSPDPVPPVPPVPGAGPGRLTLAMLQRNWTPAKPELIRGMANNAAVLEQLGINTPLRMAHFMAQISEECGRGREMIESLGYSAQQMMRIFPKRFPDLASTAPFVGNERAFGDRVYNGRMGNRMNTDDGFNFRGRGCLQLTGRDNYAAMGKACGLDLANNPDLAIDPANVLSIAATEFVKLGCLPECDRDDVVQVSARVNLGHRTDDPRKINGLDERRRQLAIWKREFGVA
jgi:putative chitinase